MDLLSTLEDATPELLAQYKQQPFSGLTLATLVEAAPTEKLTLLAVQPKIDTKGEFPKAGYVCAFQGKQYLVKLDNDLAGTVLAPQQQLTPQVRDFQSGNRTIKYVVAVQ